MQYQSSNLIFFIMGAIPFLLRTSHIYKLHSNFRNRSKRIVDGVHIVKMIFLSNECTVTSLENNFDNNYRTIKMNILESKESFILSYLINVLKC